MKKILTLVLSLISTGAFSQTMYKMESVPLYDSIGNVYQTRQVYDHLPTHDDSVAFQKDAKSYVAQILKAHKQGRGEVSYQAIVAEVRISNGKVIIKPTSKFRSPWYKYYDPNVKVGDTIWISRQDAIEPKF